MIDELFSYTRKKIDRKRNDIASVSYTHLDVYKRQPKVLLKGKKGTVKLTLDASQLNQQEEIYHRMNSRFTLSHPDGFHKKMCIRDSS